MCDSLHIAAYTLLPVHLCLRSVSCHQVSVPRYGLSTYGRRPFSVAGLKVWNSLPEDMRDPECSVDSYRVQTVTEDIFIFAVLVCSVH